MSRFAPAEPPLWTNVSFLYPIRQLALTTRREASQLGLHHDQRGLLGGPRATADSEVR